MMAMGASAQSPASVVDKVLAALKGGKAVSASYAVASPQGSSRGTLVMSGKKFRVLASDVKCWYNGTTMWSYSPATDEVNITTPTAADLQIKGEHNASNALAPLATTTAMPRHRRQPLSLTRPKCHKAPRWSTSGR